MADKYGSQNMLWHMAERLRDEPAMMGHELPSVLAALILLRWADFQEAESEAVAAFEETEYRPLLPASYHWRRWHLLRENDLHEFVTRKIPAVAREIQDFHNPLSSIILRAGAALRDLSLWKPSTLICLVDWLAKQRFETLSDRMELLHLFDYLVDKLEGRGTYEFRTPRAILTLLISLIDISEGKRIYDPCFGTGGFLTEACIHLRKNNEGQYIRQGLPDISIYGLDINQDVWLVAMARLMLIGAREPQLETGNSLERDSVLDPSKKGFDIVTCNPPWGMRIHPDGRDHFPIRTNDSTSLFIQHVLAQLRPGGQGAVIVPQGLLYQRSKAAGNLRKWLIENHSLEAIINLPDGAFLPLTSIKAAILLFRRNSGGTKRVRFIDTNSIIYRPKGKQSITLSDDQIRQIHDAKDATESGEFYWDLELSEIRKLDYDLIPIRREKSRLEKTLESLGKDVEIVTLKDLCNFVGGAGMQSKFLENNPSSENATPYIRIGDITGRQVNNSKSWILESGYAKVDPRKRLQNGQILLSRSGTIGKVGVVRNGAVGGLASNGLFVMTPDQNKINPHFLAAYLESEPCAEFLGSHSTGSAIQHLRLEYLKSTPVPVPAVQVQKRVVEELDLSKLGFFDQLSLILNESEDNPALRWLGMSLKLLSEFKQKPDGEPGEFVCARIFGKSFSSVMSWMVETEGKTKHCHWLEEFASIYLTFKWTLETPRGSARVSVLQQGINLLKEAIAEMNRRSSLDSRAYKLASQCERLLNESVEAQLSDVELLFALHTKTLTPGKAQNIEFSIINKGVSPVNNVSISFPEWDFSFPIAFIQGNSEKRFSFSIEIPTSFLTNCINVNWEGWSLSGKRISGALEFYFDIEDILTEGPEIEDLGNSPYFVSEPVGPDRKDVFFGREKLINKIKNQILSQNTVLLEGNRRAGKSSLLKHLEGKDTIPGWLSIYSSLQGASGTSQYAGVKSEDIWRSIAFDIISACKVLNIDLPLPDGSIIKAGQKLERMSLAFRVGIGVENSWDDFRDYLSAILEAIKSEDLGIVLMIDEFDKLQEGIDHGITSPQVPENIRYLIQNFPKFSAILTGSRRMKRLRNEYWSALFGLGNRIGVTALDEKSARYLITEPVAGRLRYSNDAIERILHLTAHQPFLIQSLCNNLFIEAKILNSRFIDLTLVDEVVEDYLEDNEHFATIWGYADSDRQRFIVALCHQYSPGPDPLTFGVIREKLDEHRIVASDSQLGADLKSLRELELLEYVGKKRGEIYKLAVPLMGEWLDRQQDFNEILANAREEQEATK